MSKSKHIAKAQKKQGRLANIELINNPVEFRILDDSELPEVGSMVVADQVFAIGDKVDVVGLSKGKGFAGTIKRYNFAQQDNTHGNSRSHRVAGTTGQNQLPGRVFPGKKMPGHMGHERVCIKNLTIVKILPEDQVILVKGSVPGCVSAQLTVRKKPSRS